MVNKFLLFGFLLIQTPLLTIGQQQDFFPSVDFARFTKEVKSIFSDYVESNNPRVDYQMIVKIEEDTIHLYLGGFVCLAEVGYLEPFMCYKINGKNLYLFMADGIKWKRDTTFHIQKSEATFGVNPIWLITLCDNGIVLKKNVRGYFSPPLPPKGKVGKFKRPKIVNP